MRRSEHHWDADRGRLYLGGQPLRRNPPEAPPGYAYGLIRTGALDDGDPERRIPRVRAVLESDDDVHRGGILIRIRPEIPSRVVSLGERALTLSERAAASMRWIGAGVLALILTLIAAATYLLRTRMIAATNRTRRRRSTTDDD